ncbi:resistin-like beta [Prionailurus bengalensis]|uniref:resistin-like beta n=1 Tax=Prionailurus bengalensis TaxID=37029 RepID=UPI001CA82F81|nr:resistin-like beta [Prionailurus bengalensis]
MKLTSYFLLILILLLQLMIPRYAQCSLDSIVDTKIKAESFSDDNELDDDGNEEEYNYNLWTLITNEISCTSIFSSGKLSSCPAGMVVTSCACGYGCGSWDIQGETTCHC